MSGRRRASDVFVECLEAEGVRYVFGIPGEETLDLNQSLANSSVTFIPVRHEQGGAYMADMIGRLTLQMNRARQATITTELMEIVGGAEALKG